MASTTNKYLVIDRDRLISIINKEPGRITLTNGCKQDNFKQFKRIVLDGKETEFCVCSKCDDNKPIKYKTLTGSRNLNRHIANFHKTQQCTTITPVPLKQTTLDSIIKKPVPLKDKQLIADKAALMCSRDFRPFSITEGEGFIDFVQSVINITCKTGMIDARQLLSTGDTVKNHSESIDRKLRKKLLEHLTSVSIIHCTTGHWTESYTCQSYMTITIQYYDNSSCKIKSRVIGTFEVTDKTAAITTKEFDEKLVEFNVLSKLRMVVTDNASSMISAFRNADWIGCSNHNLSLVHKYALGYAGDKTNPVPSITKLVDSCKKLVEHVKRSGKNKELESRLKQEVSTRWDTIHDMLESVSVNWKQLIQLDCIKDHIDEINHGLLNEVIAVMQPLKEMRIKLSSESEPTFFRVALTHDRIIQLMKLKSADSDGIKVLKSRYVTSTKQKFTVTPFHLIATWLTPKYSKFEFSNGNVSKKADEELRRLIDIVEESDNEMISDDDGDDSDDSLFNAFQDKSKKIKLSVNEIEKYRDMAFTQEERKMEPLEFWNRNTSSFPKLSSVAHTLLTAPATNNSSERVFSAVKNFITPIKNKLKAETVDRLMFVRSNFDLM